MTDDDAAPALDAGLAFAHHLLVLAEDVYAEDVEALAASRFEGAARRGPRLLALTGDAVLTGPWAVDDAARAALALPAEAALAYLLRAPVLRGAPPSDAAITQDARARAFADGMPFGVEGDAVDFLVAAARRLGGAVRIAGSGQVVVPDPDSDVDLWVYAPVWLDPQALLAVVGPALPGLTLAMDLAEDPAVADVPPPPPVPGFEPLDEGERAWLHAEARAFDEAALAAPAVLDAYGAAAGFPGGVIEVSVEGEEAVPLALRGLEWTEGGVVAYALRWWPAGDGALADPPTAEARRARAQARALIEVAARALLAAAGGEVADESGFLIDPETIAEGPVAEGPLAQGGPA